MQLVSGSILTQGERAYSRYDPRSVSGLVLWLDPNILNAYYNDGDRIEYWYDRSGYDHHAYQNSGAIAPTLVKERMGGNSLLSLTYTLGQYMTIARTSALEPNNITVFTVTLFWSGSTYEAHIISKPYRTSGWTTPYSQYSICASHATTTGRYKGHMAVGSATLKNWYEAANGFGAYSPIIGCTIYDGTATVRQYVNNWLQTLTYAAGGTATGNIDYTGGTTDVCLFAATQYSLNQYYHGYAGDILIYNTALSDVNRAIVTNYLAAKYNSLLILATGLP